MKKVAATLSIVALASVGLAAPAAQAAKPTCNWGRLTAEAIADITSTGATLDANGLISWCRESLTAYKVPRHVEFRDELPKTNVGKILRRALRDS